MSGLKSFLSKVGAAFWIMCLLIGLYIVVPHFLPYDSGFEIESLAIKSAGVERTWQIDDIRVVDGDTIYCTVDLGLDVYKAEGIRIYGVDTPELRSTNIQERAEARKAKAFTEKFISDHPIFIRSDGSRGKYGRLLARVIRYNKEKSEEDLTNALINNNLGTQYIPN